MATFSYTAKALDGTTKTGVAEAENVKELARILREEGLFLANANCKTQSGVNQEKNRFGFQFNFISSHKKVSLTEKMLVTRNLAVMVSTGLSLVKGFSILAAQSKSKRMKEALLDIGQEVSKGKNLADCFKKYPDIFPELFQSMIQAGEESGTLEDVLGVLSLQLEKEKEMKSKIQKALIYPAILVVVMLIVGVCLAMFVLPKMKTFFSGLDADLPIMTQIILGSGDFFMQYWYFLLVASFVAVTAFIAFVKSKTGRLIIDNFSLKIPIVSSLVKKSNTASLIRSLSSLLYAGVPLIRSLEITSGIVTNFCFKKAMREASKDVEKGKKLSVGFSSFRSIFPYGAIEMIEVGEETGKTSIILKKLAEFYEEEVSNIAENLSTIIEPAMLIVIGAAVGVFAVSIIGPLYSVLGKI